MAATDKDAQRILVHTLNVELGELESAKRSVYVRLSDEGPFLLAKNRSAAIAAKRKELEAAEKVLAQLSEPTKK
jgi:hypothetical protein